MKLSNYNFLFNVRGKDFFFNSRTGALAEVDSDFFRVVEQIKKGEFCKEENDQDLISEMEESGAIINDEVNELLMIEYEKNQDKYNKDFLIITILPTLDCNCKCEYCYENREKGVITEKVQNGIIDFISSQKQLKKLHVSWFGGEPFLAKDIIFALSEKIITLCQKRNIEYESSMVSNLTLLKKNDIDKLKKYMIKRYQVTLDGPEDIHNRRRLERNNVNSFRTILDNIKLLLAEDFFIDIRVNIDNTNKTYVKDLLHLLKKELITSSNLTFHPGRVVSFNDYSPCKNIETHCISSENWYKTEVDFYNKCISSGFANNVRERIIKQPKILSCGAESANTFVIDKNGYMYKCVAEVGDIKKSFTNVCNFSENNYSSNKYLKWIVPSTINEAKCNKCKLLPICQGGCRFEKFKANKNLPECNLNEKQFKEYLITYVLNMESFESEGVYENTDSSTKETQ